MSGRVDDIFLDGPAQEWWSISLQGVQYKIEIFRFAQLDPPIVWDCSKRLRVRYPLGDGTLRGISPTFSQSLPSAKTAQGEFCPNRASPDNRVRIVYRSSAGFGRPRIHLLARSARNRASDTRRSRSNSPSTVPNSNFVSATMIPFCAAYSRPRE